MNAARIREWLALKIAPWLYVQPTTIRTTVNLDGKQIATNVTRHQQKMRRRNPSQKRGQVT